MPETRDTDVGRTALPILVGGVTVDGYWLALRDGGSILARFNDPAERDLAVSRWNHHAALVEALERFTALALAHGENGTIHDWHDMFKNWRSADIRLDPYDGNGPRSLAEEANYARAALAADAHREGLDG